jgi:hypothetical protein
MMKTAITNMTLKNKAIMTEFERLEKRLFGDPNKKLKNFHYTMDKEAFAAKYGGIYTPGDFGVFDGNIDWTHSPFTEEERTEGLAKSLNDFMDAAEDPTRSYRLSSSTDEWGNMLDENHMDYMTFDERLAHVLLCRQVSGELSRGLSSRFEYEMVILGHLPPASGKTIADYEAEWEERQANRDERGFGRYPKVDLRD